MLYRQAIFLLLAVTSPFVADCKVISPKVDIRLLEAKGLANVSTPTEAQANMSVATVPANVSMPKVEVNVSMPKVEANVSVPKVEVNMSTPASLANKAASLGKFGNNLTLDDCESWDAWKAPAEAKEVWNYYRSGYDEEGNVVYVSEFGKLNYKKLEGKSAEKVEEFWKYYEQSMLRTEYDTLHNNNGDGVIMLYDLEGFTLANYASSAALKFSLKMFTTITRLNKAIKSGFAINVNFAGEAFIRLAKPFLGNGLDKFELYGTRSQKWKPKLLKRIPADQLPPVYGGLDSWTSLPMNVCKKL